MKFCKKKATKSSKWITSVVVLLSLDISLMAVFSNGVALKWRPSFVYILGVVITNCLISVLLCLLRYAYRIKVREDVLIAMAAAEKDLEADAEFLKTLTGLPTRFSFTDLERATENFSRKLGRGGFGTVYEGLLADGVKVAVKRLEREGRGQKEFCAEVATISRIRHVNLVSLKGFCAEGAERLLVYEYMAGLSLDTWLFRNSGAATNSWNPKCSDILPSAETPTSADTETDASAATANNGPVTLNWETRFSIALDTARGLAYLHEECEERILHLDVKPQNILLDEQFRAKVADFGLSRSMGREQSRVLTTMRGTPGYLAPEWLLGSGIDSKTDVYGYGMVLLELVSGRRNVDQSLPNPEHWYLPAMAFNKLLLVHNTCGGQDGVVVSQREEELDTHVKEADHHDPFLELVDPLLQDKLDNKAQRQAHLMILVALWCIQENASSRPSMSSIVQMLEGNMPLSKPPILMSSRNTGLSSIHRCALDELPLISITVDTETLSPR